MAAIPGYADDSALSLKKGSVDNKAAKKKKGLTANVPGTYVSDLQADLITLGYIEPGGDDGEYGPGTEHAVKHFERHSMRLYRMKGGQAADVKSTTFGGTVDGVCDKFTAKEIKLWLTNSWVLPLNRFPIVNISGGKLRQDAAKEWNAALLYANSKGAYVPASYGDTTRNHKAGFTSTGGNSAYSLHYAGRAVDLGQEEAGWIARKKSHGRWYVAKDQVGSDLYWRIWCKTDKQDGTQGQSINGAVPNGKSKTPVAVKKKYYDFYGKKEENFPAAYYVDLTDIFAKYKFLRIPAHSNWKSNPKGMEWWHYYYSVNVQDTFLDEMELRGVSQKELRKYYWNTYKRLDRKPG